MLEHRFMNKRLSLQVLILFFLNGKRRQVLLAKTMAWVAMM